MENNVVLLDNYDSFTYNLVEQFRSGGSCVTVYRNNVDVDVIRGELQKNSDSILVMSPGPGRPEDAGNMLALVDAVRGGHPMIGICLGHQAIIQSYGGEIGNANEVFHGKASMIQHQGTDMFEGMPCPLQVARYHSLAGTVIPPGLDVIAQMDETIMAVVNRADRVCGFQFHPESVMTPQGITLLNNTLRWLRSAPVNV